MGCLRAAHTDRGVRREEGWVPERTTGPWRFIARFSLILSMCSNVYPGSEKRQQKTRVGTLPARASLSRSVSPAPYRRDRPHSAAHHDPLKAQRDFLHRVAPETHLATHTHPVPKVPKTFPMTNPIQQPPSCYGKSIPL